LAQAIWLRRSAKPSELRSPIDHRIVASRMSYSRAESDAILSEDAVALDTRGRFGKVVAMSAGLLMAVVATAAATTMMTLRMATPHRGSERNIEGLDGMLAVKPAYENCAQATEDCLVPRCCGAAGLNCFKVSGTKGRCMKACTPGGSNGTCEGVAPHMRPVAETPGLSLFCFAVYTENTGSPKPSQELELLQLQHDRAVSIFSCAEWAVYGDVVAPLGGGDMTIAVDDVRGDFHILKRKETKTWVNSGMFVQVWSAIRDAGHYKNHNWVIKADADAVFFPHKLLNVLKTVPVPQEGIYLENCKFVDWGYFGNLEVFSKQAFITLVDKDNLDHCYSALPWKVGVHGGKFGPMGEDLFAQKCMDMLGVGRQENWELTTDGACPADRPEGEEKNKKYVPDCAGVSTPSIHPFKKPEQYIKCLGEAASVNNA